ncbi:MAG TPA: T9SS type A sorting domain-containing protein [Candidatus Acidoferrales bacterium]|nr:T9SS type A sorting domain-containing protein [Candidatus Acidoferrales bacterium]
MNGLKIFSCIALIFLISSVTMAQTGTRVIESFDYQLGSVLDTLGTAGNGWAGSWYISDSSTNHNSKMLAVADTGIADYESALAYPINRAGHAVCGSIPSGWTYIRYARYLSHPVTNEAKATYWLSFVNDLEYGSPNCWNVCSFWDSTYEEFGAPHGWGNDTAMINNVSGTGVPGLLCQGTGPHWWVLRLDLDGDTSAVLHMWHDLDPSGGKPDTASADARGTYSFWKHGTVLYDSVLHHGFNAVHLEFSNSNVGTQAMFAEVRLDTSWAGVSDNDGGKLTTGVNLPPNTHPTQFVLSQNYPNPFNPTTRIEYTVPQNSLVTLKVYNILGQEVATLFSGLKAPGTYSAIFDGSRFASGVYSYRLQAGSNQITKKLVLLK